MASSTALSCLSSSSRLLPAFLAAFAAASPFSTEGGDSALRFLPAIELDLLAAAAADAAAAATLSFVPFNASLSSFLFIGEVLRPRRTSADDDDEYEESEESELLPLLSEPELLADDLLKVFYIIINLENFFFSIRHYKSFISQRIRYGNYFA